MKKPGRKERASWSIWGIWLQIWNRGKAVSLLWTGLTGTGAYCPTTICRGAIIGLTLHTKTEEIYRALVEANIFGSRKILENYKNNGVAIDAIYAVGGLRGRVRGLCRCARTYSIRRL